jgi:hypothetical protein
MFSLWGLTRAVCGGACRITLTAHFLSRTRLLAGARPRAEALRNSSGSRSACAVAEQSVLASPAGLDTTGSRTQRNARAWAYASQIWRRGYVHRCRCQSCRITPPGRSFGWVDPLANGSESVGGGRPIQDGGRHRLMAKALANGVRHRGCQGASANGSSPSRSGKALANGGTH